MKYTFWGITLLISLLGFIVFIIVRLNENKKISILNATLTVDEMETYAKRAALAHTVVFGSKIVNWPLVRVNDNYNFIKTLYEELNDEVRQKKAVTPSAEWLLDNYYIIENQIQYIRKNLIKNDYRNLPKIKTGPLRGNTRALAIAMEFVTIMDGQIEEESLLRYLKAYQTHSILFDREIRIMPMMIQIALLENISILCENIQETQKQWKLADGIVDKWWTDDSMEVEKIVVAFKNTVGDKVESNTAFVEHLFYRFRRSEHNYVYVLKYINEYLLHFSTKIEEIAQKEHNAQALNTVSIGNSILSLKYMANIDWIDLFEAISFVEKILQNDPEAVYGSMSAESRGYYMMQIEKLAKIYGVSERYIAQGAVDLAQSTASKKNDLSYLDNDYLRKSHIGFYITGDGVRNLKKYLKLSEKLNRRIFLSLLRNQGKLYIGAILLSTALLVGLTLISGQSHKISYLLLIGFIAVIPASEVAISLINWMVGKFKKPAFFSSLELKKGIPDELRTLVVVPTLLSSEERVEEIIQRLENHYLANKEKNLYFALIGGFKDSHYESDLKKNPILIRAQEGIDGLNKKYNCEEKHIFHFFHRKNVFNENEQKWTGWERKRGALMEFNELLLGAQNTSFISHDNCFTGNNKIKYIITLDADTQLPLGMAKKMIGTMAHPCNLPIVNINKNIVVEGYGLMQPKILFDMESANKSIFSRIYTGQKGIDPYANSISDVYQDLFGEGIFTGKGIYDLNIFRNVLKDVVPENAVLSHDLLEGSYVRAALVSNLELVDDYPTRYNAYISRLYRWIRGDWQLIPWLRSNIYNTNKELIANPLSRISIWKIADNLRRSLVAPSLMLCIILSLGVLPGNVFVGLGKIAFVILLPLLINIMEYITRTGFKLRASKSHIPGFFGLKATLFQILFTFIFLPYQSVVTLHAIGVTLVRVFITKKKMLEWVTSDDAEKIQSNSLGSYLEAMWMSLSVGLIGVGLSLIFRPQNTFISLVFMIIWGIAPFIAYHISKSTERGLEILGKNEIKELRKIARKTWRYFEDFANKKNNYLAPDNYQEDPYKGIAYRTSPTNIGLGLLAILTARDFGYINTEGMFRQIGKTIKTIEQMEKWNGHLYNWYDTRSLKALKPHYISTVDSGNLVCYLMTLSQGIKSYFEKPLIDKVLLSGIEDTYICAMEKNIPFFNENEAGELDYLNSTFSLNNWKKTLEKASEDPKIRDIKAPGWQYKLEHMISENLKEIENFMPWINLIDAKPSILNESDFKNVCDEWIMLLDTPMSMKNYNKHCCEIYEKSKVIIVMTKEKDEREVLELVTWVASILEKVDKGKVNMEFLVQRYDNLIKTITRLSEDAKFKFLYEKKHQLFSIGFNVEDNKLSNSFYDLLASEARQTSYIAIARGEVDAKHWNKLGRSLTVVDGYKGLISWSGTMFEYLMPLILMKNYKNTLLDETYTFVINCQKKYGKSRHMPWGVSECGFGLMDRHLDYQYKAIGVPWLGLKRGLMEDAVVAPYATFLALLVKPIDAYKNIQYLKKEGLEGEYGYYEAADYTPDRKQLGQDKIIVKSYMAHHQGMSLLAINNYLNDNVLQTRFLGDAYVKAGKLLLQEKIPTNIFYTKENKEKILPFKGSTYHEKESYRKFEKLDLYLPKAHVLSNGYYSTLMTDRGTGYSRTKNYDITRWREDLIQDGYGLFFYIKNKETYEKWSATYAPINELPESYEVVFTDDKMVFKRVDGKVETSTEIIVTSGENAEIRRLELKNNGEKYCDLEVTSYCEVVMAERKADESHPAFSNLFIETEFNYSYNALLARRRPRSVEDREQWIAHMVIGDGKIIGDTQYETDRMRFIGRGHTVSNPQAIEIEKPLSNTTGNVLDPILSLRVKVSVPPDRTAKLLFITMVSDSKEQIMDLIIKYSSIESCDAAFWLAVIRSQIETKYLNIRAYEMELYQDMISDIIFLSPLRQKSKLALQENKQGQDDLWRIGISGDRPIVLLKIQNEENIEILYELLKAQEYWRIKDLRVDLVIIVLEDYGYLNPVFSLVKDIVFSRKETFSNQKTEDIFIFNYAMISQEDIYLLTAVARMNFDNQGNSIKDQMKRAHIQKLNGISVKEIAVMPKVENSNKNDTLEDTLLHCEALDFYNGLGGFGQENQSYFIELENDQTTPLPWSNVICNEKFGFITTESGGGYTWSQNSHENKLTPWSNDPVCDSQGEIIYLRDEAFDIWSITSAPIREKSSYHIEHGFGFTTFKHVSHGLNQSLTQFVPLNESIKLSLIELKNESEKERNITLTYYIEPVLGNIRSETVMHQVTEIVGERTLVVTNKYNKVFANQVLFMDASVLERSYSGNRTEFLGQGGKKSPDGLKNRLLNNTVGSGYDSCAVIQVNIKIPPQEAFRLTFMLGVSEEKNSVLKHTEFYKTVDHAVKALEEVQQFWKEKLGIIQIVTPDLAMNKMINGHLLYQTIACRLWARTSFYQAGGAYGFRDQLQDTLAVLSVWPEITRAQIIKNARHQFVEGDVLHWWHEPELKGTRTKISDDFLWLPYAVAQYLKVTAENEILDVKIPFLECDPLETIEDERYVQPTISAEEGSLYEHCIRAIENGLKFGVHGLPLMGGGDWNDGMNKVGNEGKGESIWLAWFLSDILKKWCAICLNHKDAALSQRYNRLSNDLNLAIEKYGWDGNWYKRAYFDDGEELGSVNNLECKIDSLAQSWAVLSGSKNHERNRMAMAALENYLINRDEGIIKLLTPPFNNGKSEPGYIKGYVPGVRENGGQYTHAAAWAIAAFAKLGEGDKAFELFEMINPINHTRTNIEVGIYKTEPYVIDADVYGCVPHIGRGGWSWYTGSAGWMYQVGLNNILGFSREGQNLVINPCIPKKWREFSIQYTIDKSTYIIKVNNPEFLSYGESQISVNGTELKGNRIPIADIGGVYNVEVTIVKGKND